MFSMSGLDVPPFLPSPLRMMQVRELTCPQAGLVPGQRRGEEVSVQELAKVSPQALVSFSGLIDSEALPAA